MRLFIGIAIPDDIKQNILEFQKQLKQKGVKGHWRKPDNLHITLEFLGEQYESSIAILSEALSGVAKNHNALELSISGLGAFPSFKRPHTLWTGITGDVGNLKSLQKSLHDELLKKSFNLDNRDFKPHITLASRPGIKGVDLSEHKEVLLGNYKADEIVLFESKVEDNKRRYIELFNAPL